MSIRVKGLGYVHLEVEDVAAWQQFASEIVGLMPARIPASENVSYFRMDEEPYRLAIQSGAETRLQTVGWELESEAMFTRAVEVLDEHKSLLELGDAEGAAARHVAAFATAQDPAGNRFEIFHGRSGQSEDFVSPAGVEGFVTGDLGMGHVVIPAPNTDETHAFYTDVMGFYNSDDLHLPPPAEGAPDQRVVFMHASNPRHHSLALYNFPVPTGIVHIIFEVTSVDDVGKCLDRVQAAEVPMMASLGRHSNDNALSFYMFGPGGIGVEYGCDGKKIAPGEYEATVSTVGDIWGHEYAPMPGA